MPTNPHLDILYRELSIVQAREILGDGLSMFEELINYGTNVLVRCFTSKTTDEENVDLAPITLYRYILQLGDAFTVLISQGIGTPTTPILRSMFEADLALEYILESPETYRIRSLQWLANHLRDNVKAYRKLLDDTPEGKQFKSLVEKDKTVKEFDLAPPANVEAAIANLETLLRREQFSEIQNEYKRLREQGKNNPKWHSLFDGPPTIEQLANHLGRHAQYDFMYRYWSKTTHAQDFSNFLGTSASGERGMRGLRDTSRLKEVSRFAASFLLGSTRLILLKFRPGEEESFSRYYVSEIAPTFNNVIKRD